MTDLNRARYFISTFYKFTELGDPAEFKEFLKSAIKEILTEDLNLLKPSLPDILNISEAAEFLKLKITTLYEKTSKKVIPHFKKGNKLYFNRNDLEP